MSTTGHLVASTNVAGASSPRQRILDALAGGVSRLVDVEVASREQVLVDRAELTARAQAQAARPVTTGLGDVVANFTSTQWLMLGVAGLLGVALLTGRFR